MSEDAVTQVSGSEAADQHHIRSVYTGVGTLQPLSEKLVDGNASVQDEVNRMSDSTTSASGSPVADERVLGFTAPEDVHNSQTTKRKRGRDLSVNGMLPPPPKKLAGSSLSTVESTNQDEVDIIAEASGRSTSLTPDSKAQAGGIINDREGEFDGDMKETSESIAQPAAIDSEMKKAKEPRKTTYHLDWYNANNVFADSTLKSKVCASGMEEFLRWEGVDLDKEFPRKGGKYTNAQGERVARNEAMKIKVQEVQQAYIDARKAGVRTVPQGWTGKGFEHEEPSYLALAHSFPTSTPAADGAAATASNKHQRTRKLHVHIPKDEGAEIVSQARTDLHAIHRYAAEQLSKAYEKRVKGIAADEGDTTKPTISPKVDRLVFDIVDCHIRLRMVRMRQDYGADTEEDLAVIASEMHSHRAQLIVELQGSMKREKDQDPVLLACQLVLQEFPANV
ncbi:hypothetical protein P171DRAFT_478687 [Karstenula rhodostoma CBS 690.94]|uniref:Uncharacterized protein n=1 Tax=Karstenula rhodostoma CBS 690.94 TaxID=1392251 RepID=A0A9P4UGZ8_9PLEO|nr:hypothetical protein P171DRAFT_478687 [Karstenula rhodostoma CBS 690.94]